MTCRFVDSFDHYTPAQMGRKWSNIGTSLGPDGDTEAGVGAWGRTGPQGCRIKAQNQMGLQLNLDNQPTLIAGFAVRVWSSALNSGPSLGFFDTTAGDWQVVFVINADGTLSAYRGGGVALLGTTSFAFTLGVWYSLEMKVTVSNTVGTVDLQVNGNSILSLTGQDTQQTANAFVNAWVLQISQIPPYTAAVDLDDFYIFDATGASCNDFIGDSRVDYAPLGADGADAGWAVTGAATKHAACATVPGDPGIYIATSTIPDSYTGLITAAIPGGLIRAVQTVAVMEKDVAGAATAVPILRHAGVDHLGANMAPGAATYSAFLQQFPTNPGTGIAWTHADLSADQIGVKRTA